MIGPAFQRLQENGHAALVPVLLEGDAGGKKKRKNALTAASKKRRAPSPDAKDLIPVSRASGD